MIVQRFEDKLLLDLAPHGIHALSAGSWEFSRTYAKKNPQALKWTFTSRSRKESRVIASQFTVNELLKFDSYEIRIWDQHLLVFPKVVDQSSMPAQGQLALLQQEIESTLNDFNQGLSKPKETLTQTLNLLIRVVSTLRGMPNERQPNASGKLEGGSKTVSEEGQGDGNTNHTSQVQERRKP